MSTWLLFTVTKTLTARRGELRRHRCGRRLEGGESLEPPHHHEVEPATTAKGASGGEESTGRVTNLPQMWVASLSIGIGQVFFPQAVSAELASTTILYTLFASAVVVSLLAVRERVDKKAGTIFITLYLLSYILFVWGITYA